MRYGLLAVPAALSEPAVEATRSQVTAAEGRLASAREELARLRDAS